MRTGARSVTAQVIRYQLSDVLRSRWIIAFAVVLLLITEALLRFGGTGTRALVSIANIVLLIIPLLSLVFGSMYLYSARAFIELLLAQPVRRSQLFVGIYAGLAIPLSLAFVLAIGLPFAAHGFTDAAQVHSLITLALVGVALTCAFLALAFLIATCIEDRVKGLGVALGVWLLVSVLYDGIVLVLAWMLADYPIETGMLAVMTANPVDLARVLLLLNFDLSALMGYTGAVFEHFFGSAAGIAVASAALGVWTAAPLFIALRNFNHRDF